MLYMTPGRLRSAGFGIDFSGVTDIELRTVLERASGRANAYTSAPQIPAPHDFRGGFIVGEQHPYDLGYGPFEGAQRRIAPWHSPIEAVSRIQIRLTNTQYIQFAANELYVSDYWVEIVSLAMTANGLFGAAIVPDIGLSKPMVVLDYSYGHTYPEVDAPLDLDGTVYRSQDQFWTDDPVAVKADGVVVDDGYTVDPVEGTIAFTDPPDEPVTASYTHRLHTDIAQATGIIAADVFGSRQTQQRGLAGLRSLRAGEITLERDVMTRRMPSGSLSTTIPVDAALLLDGFRFMTAR